MASVLQILSYIFDSEEDRSLRSSIKNLLGFRPNNLALYKLALTHRSAAVETGGGIKLSNERLEFLGDAILGAVIANMLFKKYPLEDEGFLTRSRSKIVSRKNLNTLSIKLGLPDMIDKNVRGDRASSIPGDALEAMIGAVFLDAGYQQTENFIVRVLVGMHLDLEEVLKTEDNYKSRLIEWCQKERRTFSFEVEEECEDKTHPRFSIVVRIDGAVTGRGTGRSKKSAEQEAARVACSKLT